VFFCNPAHFQKHPGIYALRIHLVAKAAVNGITKAASAILNPLWLDLSTQKDHLPLIGVNLSD
jgi:hypothetical protein